MKINKNLLLLILIIVLETIIIKASMYNILPEKYFYDSNLIINVVQNGSNLILDTARKFTVNFFKMLNFLGLITVKQWGYLISFIFTIITIFFISKYKNLNLIQIFFIISSVALLNIYVYTIGKDIIQFIIFLLIYLILKKPKYSNNKKLLLISILLILEALFFRTYYLIMAILMITIYIIYKLFTKSKQKKNFQNTNLHKKSVIKMALLIILVFFLEIGVLKFVSIDNYNSIMNARASVNVLRLDSIDAQSIIIDIFGPNSHFYIFMENYIVNLFRLLFPIELLFNDFGNIKYILFIIYQLMITVVIIKDFKKINNSNVLWIITIISYIMVSVLFEPDFGSFIRHESCTFLILLELFAICFNHQNKIPNDKLLDEGGKT